MSNFVEARLAICNSCPFNVEGSCAYCGCDVATKVLDPEETCPAVPSRWGGLSTPTTGQVINQGICVPCSKR